jgi:N-methylhydantoinase A
MYRVGFDVGGTFTDFTLLREDDGTVSYFKVPSTPADPSQAIESGLAALIKRHAIAPTAFAHVGHGTTVATNLTIERKGAVTGLLVTKGFRDVLEIGRQTRPHLYDYTVRKPPPLVPRELRIEIDERVLADGTVMTALDDAEVERAAKALAAAGCRAVAICFLHAYRRPDHERRAREIVRKAMPDAYVSPSSDVLPEFREYERMSTTVLNAYMGPRMGRYLEQFLARVRGLGIPAEPYTVHSNGGLMSVETVRGVPVRTCLSGPAAGVIGAAQIGRAVGFPNLVTFDVGGTSTDVSLVHEGQPLFASNRLVADYPVKTPMIDIHVIGAGGGSIAAIDDAGALKVGPRSAGADPGPVAYGKGGTQVTITDANITLGRLDPVALLDGAMPIDAAAARAAIEAQIARPLDLSVEEAAHGIVRIANANMARAIRSVSTERGYDVREFALFAYGGAGPLHAVELAADCAIATVIVPQEPGTLCARGILLSDISLDFVRSLIVELADASWQQVIAAFASMREDAERWLAGERVAAADRKFRMMIDARYAGQNFEVQVELPDVRPGGRDAFAARFKERHIQEYGYDVDKRAVEVVNCRLQAIGTVPKAPLEPVVGGTLAQALKGRRKVFCGAAAGWQDTPVYRRAGLPVDQPIAGPAIIDEMSATTLVLPGQSATVDRLGNIIVRIA